MKHNFIIIDDIEDDVDSGAKIQAYWKALRAAEHETINKPKMNNSLIDSLKAAKTKLDDQVKIIEDHKCVTLINVFLSIPGQMDMVKELREKGLPKQIFVSPGIDKEIVNHLSHFAGVCVHHLLTEPKIMFSWSETYCTDLKQPTFEIEI